MTEKYSNLVADTIETLQQIDAIDGAVSDPGEVTVLRDLADCQNLDDLVVWGNTIAKEHGNVRAVMDLIDTIIETTGNEYGLEALGDHIRDPPMGLQERLPVKHGEDR